jgi:hypothetical protein
LRDIEQDLSYHLAVDTQQKFWYLPTPKTRIPAVSAAQLSGLTAIAAFMTKQGHGDYAQMLGDLRDTL